MKNKIVIIIVCILIITSIACLVGFVLHNNTKLTNQYDLIFNRINSKETFNFVLLRNIDGNEKIALDFYKEVYDVKFELLEIDLVNEKCRKLIKYLDSNINLNDNASYFVVVEEGQIVTFLMGELSEESLREYFIDKNIIDKKYKDIDAYANDITFDEYFNSDKEHYILFIYYDDPDLNKYRKILKDNSTPSFILFPNYSNQINVQKTVEKLLNLKENDDIKLPILLKVKSGESLSIEKKITINNFLKNIKK